MVEALALSMVLLLLSVEDVLSRVVKMAVPTGALDGGLLANSGLIELVSSAVRSCRWFDMTEDEDSDWE